MSPELITNYKLDITSLNYNAEKCDIFSLGISYL